MSVPTTSETPRIAKRRDRTIEPLTAREQERLHALLKKRGGIFYWLWTVFAR